MALNATRRFFTGFAAALAASDRTNKRATAVTTREQLCVGFNNDFEACQRETKAYSEELRAKSVFNWADISKRLAEKYLVVVQLNSTAFKADIRVDTNRDVVIDVEGSSDQQGKDQWIDASGAIFRANIGNSGERCKKLLPERLPSKLAENFETLSKCHNADDDKQRYLDISSVTRLMNTLVEWVQYISW
ncbi:hypothetical protein NHJ6243_006119 [Beauveria neobassiana]